MDVFTALTRLGLELLRSITSRRCSERSPRFGSRREVPFTAWTAAEVFTPHLVVEERGFVLCSILGIATDKDYPSVEWRGGKGIRT
jgi:hypothetical protein